LGEAEAVTVCIPSPDPAVKLNVHDDFAVEDVWWSVWAPVMSTHFVSLDVVTVSVSAPPLFAKSMPPTLTVPTPPVNAADDTVEPRALPPRTVTSTTVATMETAKDDQRPRLLILVVGVATFPSSSVLRLPNLPCLVG